MFMIDKVYSYIARRKTGANCSEIQRKFGLNKNYTSTIIANLLNEHSIIPSQMVRRSRVTGRTNRVYVAATAK